MAALLAVRFETIAGRHASAPPAGLEEVGLDLLDRASIAAAFERARPDAVVHCAAQSDPDRSEADPAPSHRLNVEASAALAGESRRRGLRLVALSTDLVFAGDRALSREEHETGPILVYGRTKLLGEEAILAEAPDAVVLRVALVAGRGHGRKATCTEKVAWSLRAGQPVRLYTDQIRTPADSAAIADAVARALERDASGRFHLGGPERLSRYELGLRVASVLGLPAALVIATTTTEMPQAGHRPADVSLDSSRARRELGWQPLPLDETIRDGRPGPD